MRRRLRSSRLRDPRPTLLALSLVALATVPLVACGTRLSHAELQRAAGGGVVATTTAGPTSTSGDAGFVAPGEHTSAGNTASDTGVGVSDITVGVLVSKSSPLGPETFSGSYYGATAYFDALNRAGGIHGRHVRVVTCDDGGTGSGNVACVHKLIDRDHVFALAGTTVFSYDGAAYVNSKGVDDVAGQPVGNDYDTYRHLWSLVGSDEPRNGQVGWDGKLYGGTEVYRWFKVRRGAKRAAVVFYNVAPSQRFARLTEAGLKAEGYSVREEQVDLGLANFDSVAVDMAGAHVDVVFDALDSAGNVRLCRAMDAHHVNVIAKVTTTQGWVQTVASDYKQAPICRNALYATGGTRNYEDTSSPAVAQFRAAVQRVYPQREKLLNEWELEGWASAQWFADAAASCGADLTRGCLESYLERSTPYDGHGLLTPRSFVVQRPGPTTRNCLNVARWQDSAQGGRGGWVTQVKDMDTECFDVPNLAYRP
jgi:ABC-type branched-subunit amino acid transport system substrate-binding protein